MAPVAVSPGRRPLAGDAFGQAEIGDVRLVLVNEDIGRFQIAVQDAVLDGHIARPG